MRVKVVIILLARNTWVRLAFACPALFTLATRCAEILMVSQVAQVQGAASPDLGSASTPSETAQRGHFAEIQNKIETEIDRNH